MVIGVIRQSRETYGFRPGFYDDSPHLAPLGTTLTCMSIESGDLSYCR